MFTAPAPNQKWGTDITYLTTSGGWVYLACELDLFGRKIVARSISNSLETPVVTKTLQNAIQSRRPDTIQLLHHSDRGCQYTSDEYRGMLKKLGITVSMGHVGYCYDNAVMERFFCFYNTERIHQTLDYVSPCQFEENYHQTFAA